MDIYLYFAKKSPLTKDGLPWLRGLGVLSFTAKRNTSGSASVSAILVRALLAHGRGEAIRESLCRAVDEAYYWLRYASLAPTPENDLLQAGRDLFQHQGDGRLQPGAIDLSSLNPVNQNRPVHTGRFFLAERVGRYPTITYFLPIFHWW